MVAKYTHTEEQPKRDKHIQRIISSVNMLNDVLNDFLSVGKIEEGKIEVSNSRFIITEFTQSVTSKLQPIFRSR